MADDALLGSLLPLVEDTCPTSEALPTRSDCPLCDRLRNGGGQCGGPDRSIRLRSASETIVDHFGYCGHHAALLLRQTEASTALRLLIATSERVIALLADHARSVERLRELCFAADRACPGCLAYGEQQTHEVRDFINSADWQRRASELCFPHYQRVVYASQSDALPALARAQLEHLRTATTTAAELIAEALSSSPSTSLQVTERLQRVWQAISDAHAARIDISLLSDSTDEVAARRDDCDDSVIAHDSGCSVCLEIAHARTNWLSAVATAARIHRDVWIVFPTCANHIRECTEIDDSLAAVMTANYATNVFLKALERGIEQVDHDNEKRVIAKRSVWYRRQSPAYILGQQRKMITRMPGCPACERAKIARDGAVNRLVHRLRQRRGHGAFEHVRQLCLKHFAAVYLLLPPGEHQTALVALQLDQIRQLLHRLEQIPDGFEQGSASLVDAHTRELRSAMRHFSSHI